LYLEVNIFQGIVSGSGIEEDPIILQYEWHGT